MPEFLLHNTHQPDECQALNDEHRDLGMPQSWKGHEFFCTCPTGDHGGYVIVEAASEEEVLAELPPMFRTGTRVINGVVFPFETKPASAASVGELA